jgi:hypothetical protein
VRNQGDYKQHDENEEENLRDSRCRDRNASEPKDRGNDRNDKKYQRPIKHLASYVSVALVTNGLHQQRA